MSLTSTFLLIAADDLKIPVLLNDKLANTLRGREVSGKITRWKEEIILELPANLSIEKFIQDFPYVSKVRLGDVLYWEQGNALCIFAGLSQPYCRARLVGLVLAYPARLLQKTLTKYMLTSDISANHEFRSIIEIIESSGYMCGIGFLEDGECITCVREISPRRLFLELYVEENYVHMCTNPILSAAQRDPRSLRILFEIAETIGDVRVDSDHYGNVCLSLIVPREIDSIRDGLRRLELAYIKASRELLS